MVAVAPAVDTTLWATAIFAKRSNVKIIGIFIVVILNEYLDFFFATLVDR